MQLYFSLSSGREFFEGQIVPIKEMERAIIVNVTSGIETQVSQSYEVQAVTYRNVRERLAPVGVPSGVFYLLAPEDARGVRVIFLGPEEDEEVYYNPVYYAIDNPVLTSTKVLFNAVVNENVREVEDAIANGADVNIRDELGYSPLHLSLATRENWREPADLLRIVQILIRAGADVNVNLGRRDTVLMLAAANGGDSIVRELIGAGANVNVDNGQPTSPLNEAVRGNYSSIAQQLVQAGARVNEILSGGNTLLHRAILSKADNDMLGFLLDVGVDPGVRNEDGFTAEDIARRYRLDGKALYLHNYYQPNVKEPEAS